MSEKSSTKSSKRVSFEKSGEETESPKSSKARGKGKERETKKVGEYVSEVRASQGRGATMGDEMPSFRIVPIPPARTFSGVSTSPLQLSPRRIETVTDLSSSSPSKNQLSSRSPSSSPSKVPITFV